MTKGIYIGVGGVARKVKKIYIGVGGVAHQVKKAYIGVNGIGRLFWKKEGTLSYNKQLTATANKREGAAGCSFKKGNCVLFAGGYYNSRTRAYVDCYNSSLTKKDVSDLSAGRDSIGVARVGNYALFAGGQTEQANSDKSIVDCYNTSLTQSNTYLSQAKSFVTGGDNEKYAFFLKSTDIEGYDASLTAIFPVAPETSYYGDAGTNLGKYAVFPNYYGAEFYDTSLTHKISSIKNTNATYTFSASIGTSYALAFPCGSSYSSSYKQVFAYNKSLTKTTVPDVSNSGSGMAVVGGKDCVIYGAGRIASKENNSILDYYDDSLTKRTFPWTGTTVSKPGAASVGDYFIFFSGEYLSSESSEVHSYKFT